MSPGFDVALILILAGLIVLFVGATILVQLAAPRGWMVGAYVLLDAALIGSGLVLLPFTG
ncbi:hypothetical protein MKI84_07895 [Ancylobacter sp. A5.8]|uniref:hypothetical protein n=1 Tax=Ancylobacter gelatini TaxID=2919920 RepID=UPI001F4DCF90|nr:hypothetical protein [Ancylobacter gelatini]MCJ8142838.1 hypothetical protein [Ancylobacter gelatini]